MKQFENIVSDRGSKYSVSGGIANDRKAAVEFIKQLTRKKKYAKATHNTWAVIFNNGEQVKNDDGENGAGAIILKMLEREQLRDHIIVVTRWYGGTHLGSDRFRHVKTCVQTYINASKIKA